MKVLRKTDRVKLLVGEVGLVIAPLSFADRIEVSSVISQSSGNDTADYLTRSQILIKKCLKDVIGMTDHSGQKYDLEFANEEKTELTDDCAEEIFKVLESSFSVTKFLQVARSNLGEVPEGEFTILGKS